MQSIMTEEKDEPKPGVSRSAGGEESAKKPGDTRQTVSFGDLPAHLKGRWKKKGLTEKSTLKVWAKDKEAALKKLSLVLGRMKDKTNEQEEIEEGGAAARTGNEGRDQGRERMAADRVHENEELEEDEELEENWTKGNKDELLFERLMKKWAK